MDDLKILEEVTEEFLNERVNPLLLGKPVNSNLDTVRLLAELQYLKAMLLYECTNIDKACKAVNELKSRFGQYMGVTIDNVDSGYITLDKIINNFEGKCAGSAVKLSSDLKE